MEKLRSKLETLMYEACQRKTLMFGVQPMQLAYAIIMVALCEVNGKPDKKLFNQEVA